MNVELSEIANDDGIRPCERSTSSPESRPCERKPEDEGGCEPWTPRHPHARCRVEAHRHVAFKYLVSVIDEPLSQHANSRMTYLVVCPEEDNPHDARPYLMDFSPGPRSFLAAGHSRFPFPER